MHKTLTSAENIYRKCLHYTVRLTEEETFVSFVLHLAPMPTTEGALPGISRYSISIWQMNEWMNGVAKSYKAAFCSYPGRCLPAGLAAPRAELYLSPRTSLCSSTRERHTQAVRCPLRGQNYHCPFRLSGASGTGEVDKIHPLLDSEKSRVGGLVHGGGGLFLGKCRCWNPTPVPSKETLHNPAPQFPLCKVA